MDLRYVISIIAIILFFSLGCISSSEKESAKMDSEFNQMETSYYVEPDPALAGPPSKTVFITKPSDPYFYKIYLLSDGEYYSDYNFMKENSIYNNRILITDDRYSLHSVVYFNYTCSKDLKLDVEVSGDGFILAYISDPGTSGYSSSCISNYSLYLGVFYTTFPIRGLRVYGIKSANSDYRLMYAYDFLRDANSTDIRRLENPIHVSVIR